MTKAKVREMHWTTSSVQAVTFYSPIQPSFNPDYTNLEVKSLLFVDSGSALTEALFIHSA